MCKISAGSGKIVCTYPRFSFSLCVVTRGTSFFSFGWISCVLPYQFFLSSQQVTPWSPSTCKAFGNKFSSWLLTLGLVEYLVFYFTDPAENLNFPKTATKRYFYSSHRFFLTFCFPGWLFFVQSLRLLWLHWFLSSGGISPEKSRLCLQLIAFP